MMQDKEKNLMLRKMVKTMKKGAKMPMEKKEMAMGEKYSSLAKKVGKKK